MNVVMLLLAIRLSGGRVRWGRVLAAGLLGALAAQGTRMMALSRGMTTALWLPMAVGMMAVACGRPALRRPLHYGGLLLCAAGLLGGVVLALSGALGDSKAAYALGGLCVLTAAMRIRRMRRGVQPARVRCICRYRGQTAAFEAMLDSGNTLRDYLTHLPVIVLPEEAGRRRMGLSGAALRPIFADTAGGRQMMGVLTPQAIWLETEGRRQAVRAVVALSPGLRTGAPALVPAALLEENLES